MLLGKCFGPSVRVSYDLVFYSALETLVGRTPAPLTSSELSSRIEEGTQGPMKDVHRIPFEYHAREPLIVLTIPKTCSGPPLLGASQTSGDLHTGTCRCLRTVMR